MRAPVTASPLGVTFGEIRAEPQKGFKHGHQHIDAEVRFVTGAGHCHRPDQVKSSVAENGNSGVQSRSNTALFRYTASHPHLCCKALSHHANTPGNKRMRNIMHCCRSGSAVAVASWPDCAPRLTPRSVYVCLRRCPQTNTVWLDNGKHWKTGGGPQICNRFGVDRVEVRRTYQMAPCVVGGLTVTDLKFQQ